MLLLLVACGAPTASITDYVHVPTAELRRESSLEDSALGPFTVDEVVYAPRLRHADHTHLSLGLVAASRIAKQARVCGVTLAGSTGVRTWDEPRELTLELDEEHQVHWGTATFGAVAGTDIAELGQPLVLTLDLCDGAALPCIIEPQTRTYLQTR